MVLCDKCTIVHHSKCEFYDITGLAKSKEAIKAMKKLIEDAMFHSSVHWIHKSWNKQKHELEFLRMEIFQLDNQLNEVLENENFHLQYQLEKQILKFKNLVDDNNVIHEYLIQSRYTQFEYANDSSKTNSLYVQQKIAEKVDIIKDQILKSTTKDLVQVFEKKQEEDKQEINKLVQSEFQSKIDELDQAILNKVTEIEDLCKKNNSLQEDIQKKESDINKLLKDNENNRTTIERLNDFKINFKVDMKCKPHPTIESLSQKNQSNLIMNFHVEKVPNENEELKDVLNRKLCDKIDGFTFNYDGKTIDISYYFESIKLACSKTKKRIFLEDLKISAVQLSDLVKASSQCRKLVFKHCTIALDWGQDSEFNFEVDDDCRLELIDFRGSGQENRSGWSEESDVFASILKAISKSKLKSSLKTIGIYACELDADSVVKAKLTENGLDHIEISEDKTSPLSF